MKTQWTKGMSLQEKQEMRSAFLASYEVRKRLKDLLEEKIESARTIARKSSSYDSPSWSLTQADSIGYERALFEIISLISEESVQKSEKKQ